MPATMRSKAQHIKQGRTPRERWSCNLRAINTRPHPRTTTTSASISTSYYRNHSQRLPTNSAWPAVRVVRNRVAPESNKKGLMPQLRRHETIWRPPHEWPRPTSLRWHPRTPRRTDLGHLRPAPSAQPLRSPTRLSRISCRPWACKVPPTIHLRHGVRPLSGCHLP